MNLDNWKTQIRKGYLELCILALINTYDRLYGFDILDRLGKSGLEIKEGTLYPLLNRMTTEGTLASTWEIQDTNGHPRKFYSLTKNGKKILEGMHDEFDRLSHILKLFDHRKGE